MERYIVKTFKLKNDSGEWKAEEREGSSFVKELLESEEFNSQMIYPEWDALQDYIREFIR